ncbi:MAG: lysophospholipid acyltransferase family protein [Myxococcales bacterium]|nr:lysophospholipid acyltransferase family protein [Myxococcales bacterium]
MSTSSEEIERTKQTLLAAFTGFLGYRTEDDVHRFRARVQELLDEVPEDDLARVVERIGDTGSEWGYYPAEPFARNVHYAMADVTLTDDSRLEHGERLDAVRDRPLILLPNHISYSDANLLEILLHRFDFDDVADRLTVVTGPKVYSDAMRRFSSLCFGTIKTAQSRSVSSGEAVMSPREVARVAMQTIDKSFERLDAGDALLIFAEGSRSRSASLQPILAAVSRYLQRPGSVLVPVGITGTENLIPVGDSHIHRTRVVIRIGEPVESETLVARCQKKRPAMAQALGQMIAAALPASYRGVYG